MQPHPLSEENPLWSLKLFSLIVNDKAAEAFGSVDRWITSKPDRYVIHNRDSKSSRNAAGQPPNSVSSYSSYASDEPKLLEVESGGAFGIEVDG